MLPKFPVVTTIAFVATIYVVCFIFLCYVSVLAKVLNHMSNPSGSLGVEWGGLRIVVTPFGAVDMEREVS